MYEAFYGFKEKPFALTPDPQFLYLAKPHRGALLQLQYGLANGTAFTLITGEIGSGKTLLLRYLLGKLDQTLTVGMITNTGPTFGKLLPWVCASFGLNTQGKDDASLYQLFTEFVIKEYAEGRRVLLIVDEAQNLGHALLEELRVLSNINADKHFLLQTILVGQPQLKTLVTHPKLRQFAQRIGANYHIGKLDREETRNYVLHRLRVAGGRLTLFHPQAIALAHMYGRGIPRLINQLCDLALVYGYSDQREEIDLDLMKEVVKDRIASGIFPGGSVAGKVVERDGIAKTEVD